MTLVTLRNEYNCHSVKGRSGSGAQWEFVVYDPSAITVIGPLGADLPPELPPHPWHHGPGHHPHCHPFGPHHHCHPHGPHHHCHPHGPHHHSHPRQPFNNCNPH
jgi:hypothetical protein